MFSCSITAGFPTCCCIEGYWRCCLSGSRLRCRGEPGTRSYCVCEAACWTRSPSEPGCREPRPQTSSLLQPGAQGTGWSSADTQIHCWRVQTPLRHQLAQDQQHSPGSWPPRTSRRSWSSQAPAPRSSVCGVWLCLHLWDSPPVCTAHTPWLFLQTPSKSTEHTSTVKVCVHTVLS